MKKIILNFEVKTNNFHDLVQEAYNMNFLDFLVSEKTYPEFKAVKRVITYSSNPHLDVHNLIFKDIKDIPSNPDKDTEIGLYWEIETKQDELIIIDESKKGRVKFFIIKARDWKVIPFENLIASMHTTDAELIASVESIAEAELMLKTLEVGTDGIIFTPKEANDIANLRRILVSGFQIQLDTAKVIDIQKISESERVCVDTTSLLKPGEGMLVGSTAKGFALVHAEVFDTQFVSSRPFRVNAGDVSAYILVPSEDLNQYRTKYLSELKGGDTVIVVNPNGYTKIVTVGRVKIETRPMLRFELLVQKEDRDLKFSYIGQNAETIRLLDSKGNPKSVVDIKIGDEILIHIGPGATHFGTAIEETIIEK